VSTIKLGRQEIADLARSQTREWLVADGVGGYAMGTVSGLRTRRYHGLLVVATRPPGGRMVGLAALDPVLVRGDNRLKLATHEWGDGTIAPEGHVQRSSFALRDGIPSWRWTVGDVVIEAELAMLHGRPALGVVHRVVRAPGPVRLELEVLCTWRDAHGERRAGAPPSIEQVENGFVFERAYRVRGPGFDTTGASWWRNDLHREEAARGLPATEDLWFAGRFGADLTPGGGVLAVEAWADGTYTPTPGAPVIIAAAHRRAADLILRARPYDDAERSLIVAADQFVAGTPSGPRIVAGYPWFGDWSRDALISYEGLFLATNRWDEGRAMLTAMAASVDGGMLPNTADTGAVEFNSVDAAPWLLHAVDRHVTVTGQIDLVAELGPTLVGIVDAHRRGTRHGIRVDDDGLLTQGADGLALTWMDARVDGQPVTPRRGKPVEVNAVWISGLLGIASFLTDLGDTRAIDLHALASQARESFRARFVRADGRGLLDVVDPDDGTVRPNQLLAASLPHAPIDDAATAGAIVRACAPLVTSIGLRSLAPDDPRYTGRHEGPPAARDAAYHQGTVWPWLLGPYMDACTRAGIRLDGVMEGLVAHLPEWGLGSVAETANGDPPHDVTGCPFQAWSVAEVLRAKRASRQ